MNKLPLSIILVGIAILIFALGCVLFCISKNKLMGTFAIVLIVIAIVLFMVASIFKEFAPFYIL